MTCSPVPAPGVAISRDPDSGTTLRHGDDLIFTCDITLDPAVDSEVAVTASWTGPGGPITAGVTDITGSGLAYQSTLTLSTLATSDSGDYTCTASVGPGDLMFINGSEGSVMLGITAGKNCSQLIILVCA